MTEAARVTPSDEEGVTYMADLVCNHCGQVRVLEMRHATHQAGEGPDIMRGVLTCRSCGQHTVFGMQGNAINFYPAQNPGAFTPQVPSGVREMWHDAELCLHGAGFRGAAAMARAAVEEALEQKGFQGVLEEQIAAAMAQGILTDQEGMLAHGSRLAGNAALHKETSLDLSVVSVSLSAAVQIVNHLFP